MPPAPPPPAPWESHPYSPAWASLQPRPPICFDVPSHSAPRSRGQIGARTSFGFVLSSLAANLSRSSFSFAPSSPSSALSPSLPSHPSATRGGGVRILEIGTFYGAGSTLDMALAIERSVPSPNCVQAGAPNRKCCHSAVVTIELFEPAWRHASRALRDLPVRCVRGTTVPVNEMMQASEVPEAERGSHFRLYHRRDAELMRSMTPLLTPLCQESPFDMVLIDGNEYTGWAEFVRVERDCRPRYLALHDTNTLKTRRIERHLASHPAKYREVLRKGQTEHGPFCALANCLPEHKFEPNAAGWAIFELIRA